MDGRRAGHLPDHRGEVRAGRRRPARESRISAGARSVSTPFRFGLIGGGRMGRTHLRGLHGSSEVEIVAVTEPVEGAASSLREQGLSVFATAEEMFAESALDGVLVAVPTPQHIDTTRTALNAGLPVL